MILTRRFYMVLILIILLMGSGYAFAPVSYTHLTLPTIA